MFEYPFCAKDVMSYVDPRGMLSSLTDYHLIGVYS
jgi:hypothetical protein